MSREIIRQECQRFTYPQSVIEYWRQLWRQRHYQLRIAAPNLLVSNSPVPDLPAASNWQRMPNASR